MRIDRHVYGSISGYRTLAKSSGVVPADLSTLESLNVGQSTDSSFMQSLASKPAYIAGSVGSKRTITQIVPGAPDDANRPTTIRVSLLFSAADWDGALRGDAGSLIGNKKIWNWDGEAKLPSLNASLAGQGNPPISAESARKLLSLISLLEKSWRSRKPVILRESTLTLDEFRLLGMLIPPAARSSYCGVYRSLTAELPASLICLAQESPVRSSSEHFRPGQEVELSPYAKALVGAGFGNGTFPFELIQSYRSFGMPPRKAVSQTSRPTASSFSMPPQVIVERMPRAVLVILLLACVLLPVVSGLCTFIVMNKRHLRAMDNNRSGHEQAIIGIQDEHEQAIEDMQDKHNQTITNMQNAHKRAIKDYRDNTGTFLGQLLSIPVNSLSQKDRKRFKQLCAGHVKELPQNERSGLVERINAIDEGAKGLAVNTAKEGEASPNTRSQPDNGREKEPPPKDKLKSRLADYSTYLAKLRVTTFKDEDTKTCIESIQSTLKATLPNKKQLEQRKQGLRDLKGLLNDWLNDKGGERDGTNGKVRELYKFTLEPPPTTNGTIELIDKLLQPSGERVGFED